MAQVAEEIKPLNTQDSVLSKKGRKVRHREDTYIASTGQNKHLGDEDTVHVVHKALADKFVDRGNARIITEEQAAELEKENAEKAKTPTKKLKAAGKGKEVKLTKAEITALTKELGHEPTEDDLAEALAAKKAKSDDDEEEEDL